MYVLEYISTDISDTLEEFGDISNKLVKLKYKGNVREKWKREYLCKVSPYLDVKDAFLVEQSPLEEEVE